MENARKQILIVEDEEYHRKNLKAFLEGSYDLLFAENAQTALDIYDSHQGNIDLILLDFALPDFDSLELYKRMEALSFTMIPNIIMVTAFGSTYDIIQTMKMNQCYYHLSKPYRRQELLSVIDDALKNKSFPRKMNETHKEFLIDQVIADRNFKISEEMMEFSRNQLGEESVTDEVADLILPNKFIAKKNQDLASVIQLFEMDTGIVAPPQWVLELLIITEQEKQHEDLVHYLRKNKKINVKVKSKKELKSDAYFDVILLDSDGSEPVNSLLTSVVPHILNNADRLLRPDILMMMENPTKMDVISAMREGVFSVYIHPIQKIELANDIDFLALRRYSLVVLPQFRDELLNQNPTFRHRFTVLNEICKKWPEPKIPLKRILSIFPELSIPHVGEGDEIDKISDQELFQWLVSKLNHETSFRFDLPTRPKLGASDSEGENETSLNSSEERERYHLLVVDDESLMVDTLAVLFKQQFIVEKATNTHEAFDVLQKEKTDVLITDYILPEDLSGKEFIDTIRAKFPKLPIILHTAHTEESDQSMIPILQDPLVIHVSKPARKDVLLEALKKLGRY